MLSDEQYDEANPQGLSCGVVDGSFLCHLQEAMTHLTLKVLMSTEFFLKVHTMAP